MRRSQASWGVMEVLIATIILGMSMGVVFFALKNIEEIRCVSELKASTLQLHDAMLTVANGNPPTTASVAFSFPTCGDKSVQALRFAYFKEAEYCRQCPGQYSGCWIIEPTVYDLKQKRLYPLVDASVCVQMPAAISLETVSAGDCLGEQMTNRPCPSTLPNGQSCNDAIEGGVPQSVFKYDTVTHEAAADSKSAWATFGRKDGDPRVFIFDLSKAVAPGRSGSIRICPRLGR